MLDGAAPLGAAMTLTGSAPEVRSKAEQLAEAGVTEIVYQPAGSDIPRELRAFAQATGGLTTPNDRALTRSDEVTRLCR
jgi:hypothetical protein